MESGGTTRFMFGLKSASNFDIGMELYAKFSRAQPELLAARNLQRRADTKFILSEASLVELSTALAKEFTAVGPPDLYQTLYFDTAGLNLFHAHRCGRRLRHKIRIRNHPERGRTFLEIKTRKNEFLTIKTRQNHPFNAPVLADKDIEFIRAHTGLVSEVLPQVWTRYRRLTLLSLRTQERLTIDMELCVGRGETSQSFKQMAIVEVKQAAYSRHTPVMEALRNIGYRPAWASKYCMAIISNHNGLRFNRLLPGMRALEKAIL